MLLLMLLIGALSLAQPAHAASLTYTGSAFLDLGSLTFGGISTSVINDSFSQGGTTEIIANPNSPQPQASYGDSYSQQSWSSRTITQSQSMGSAVSIADTGILSASSSIVDQGSLFTQTFRQFAFVATTSGYLTASINYTLTQDGTGGLAIVGPILLGSQGAGIGFNVFGGPLSDSMAVISTRLDSPTSTFGSGLNAGTLSLTQWFNVGQGGDFVMQANSSSYFATVPEPSMFWPMLIGLLGVAVYLGFPMRSPAPALCAVLLSGCINISTELQPPNEQVESKLEGSDCSLILLGFGLGTNHYAKALTGWTPGAWGYDPDRFHATIQRVHSVQFHNWQFMGLVGQQCLEIWGE